MAPFGFLDDGFSDESFVDGDGDRWYTKSDQYDEYGTTGGGWELWNY